MRSIQHDGKRPWNGVLLHMFFHNEDYIRSEESAAAVAHEVNILSRHGVKGDLWFTALTANNLADERPEIVERIRTEPFVVGYHGDFHCPFPTPLERILGLDWDTSVKRMMEWEASSLDPVTGGLDSSRPGGLRQVEEVFGKVPSISAGAVQAGAPGAYVHHQMGIRMGFVPTHGFGPPMQWFMGLLSFPRSMEFWGAIHAKYKHGGLPVPPGPSQERYCDPIDHLKYMLAVKKDVPFPIISMPMHDYDFYSPHGWVEYGSGMVPQSWAQSYGVRGVNPPGLVKGPVLGDRDVKSIAKEFDRLVEFCASEPSIRIVTSDDFYDMVEPLEPLSTLTQEEIRQCCDYLLAFWDYAPPPYVAVQTETLSLCEAFVGITGALAKYSKTGSLPDEVEVSQVLGPTDTPYYLGFPSFRPAKQVDWLVPRGMRIYQRSGAMCYEGKLYSERITRPPRLVKTRDVLDAVVSLTVEDRITGSCLVAGVGTVNPAEFLYLAAQTYLHVLRNRSSAQVFCEESCVLPAEVSRDGFFSGMAGPLDQDWRQQWLLQLQSWTLKPAVLRTAKCR